VNGRLSNKAKHTVTFDISNVAEYLPAGTTVPNCFVETGEKIDNPNLTPNLLGYDIVWYCEDTDFEWVFRGYSVSEDFTLTAKLEPKKEMQYFIFTSTEDTCIITGAKEANLPSLYIPGYVTEIAAAAFEHCNFGEIVIAEGVTKIGVRAFNDNDDLRTVSFPSTLTYLGSRLFGTSSESTITITYNGTTQQLKAIETGITYQWHSANDSDLNVICTNGTLTY
jgi:hypothetical protein